MTRPPADAAPTFAQRETVRALVGLGRTESLVARPRTVAGCREVLAYARRRGLTVCPRGAGHSYGDLALNDAHVVLDTTGMRRVLDYDGERGRMVVEPGVTILDVYRVAHAEGWVLPASPTEASITVAGAIAANVNGKDAWRVGSFGDQVLSVRLLTASGRILDIDRDRDATLFRAVVGGLGLLGVIVEATLRLRRVPSPLLEIRRTPVPDLAALLAMLETVRATSDFAVVWLDPTARGRRLGRGVVHATLARPGSARRGGVAPASRRG